MVLTMLRLREVVLFCVLLLHVTSCRRHDSSEKRPNIVFILADDYGYNDIGYHWESEILTPNLDRLASYGVKLENYYVQPICTPTRSTLLSGRYQIHTGLVHNIIGTSQPNGLPLNSPTLADKMKEAGYSTNMVGKWHLGFFKNEYCPWNRGFDTYFGYLGGSEDHYTHKSGFRNGGHGQNSTQYLDLRDQTGPVWTEEGHYGANMFTEKAINVIESHNGDDDKPLFLYLAYQSVHFPLQVPKKYEDLYHHIKDNDRRTYAGMVSAMDEGVGNITEALKKSGLWEDTIIIFSTDNGGTAGSGGNNYPLRGQKWTLWEGGVHGIGFVSGGWPLKTEGLINKELIHVSDWYPTLVGLAKGNLNGTLPLDGFDQWDTISKGTPSKRTVLLHNIDILAEKSGTPLYNDTFDTSVQAAVRVGDFKLLTGDPGNGSWILPPGKSKALMFESEKEDLPTKNVWLFNIRDDPEERTDLSEQKPEVVKELLDYLQKFNDTAVPPLYPPNDPAADPALHGGVWGPWR